MSGNNASIRLIDVELQAEAVEADGVHDRRTLGHGVQEEARHVAVVDRLDDDLDALGRRLIRRPSDVRCI